MTTTIIQSDEQALSHSRIMCSQSRSALLVDPTVSGYKAVWFNLPAKNGETG